MKNWRLDHRDANLILTGPTCARVGCDRPAEIRLDPEIFDAVTEMLDGDAGGFLGKLLPSNGTGPLEMLVGEEIRLEAPVLCRPCSRQRWSKPTPPGEGPKVEDDLADLYRATTLLARLVTAHRAHDAGRVHQLLERAEGMDLPEPVTEEDGGKP